MASGRVPVVGAWPLGGHSEGAWPQGWSSRRGRGLMAGVIDEGRGQSCVRGVVCPGGVALVTDTGGCPDVLMS